MEGNSIIATNIHCEFSATDLDLRTCARRMYNLAILAIRYAGAKCSRPGGGIVIDSDKGLSLSFKSCNIAILVG